MEKEKDNRHEQGGRPDIFTVNVATSINTRGAAGAGIV
jgi:hypothetical protein